jgi:hypothetical protein
MQRIYGEVELLDLDVVLEGEHESLELLELLEDSALDGLQNADDGGW